MFCLSPGGQTICLSPRDKHLLHTGGRGTNIFHTQGGGDKHFCIEGGGQTFFVGGGGGHDDADKKMDVS